MCGFGGVIGQAAADAAVTGAIARSLHHRGPDGSGFLAWRRGERAEMIEEPVSRAGAEVAFAHNRLSIIDLGHHNDQPFVDASGELALAYNGELYNYVELRDELRALGHEFRTEGDTEVVLAAYRQWGRDCVVRFVGMWAFALLDSRDATVLLSRDRFGIKPLYWSIRNGSFYFASEIKALLALGVDRSPDERVVRRYLLTGRTDESDATFFASVRQLPQAHDVVIDVTTPAAPPAARRWWSPPPGAGQADPDEERHFAELMRDSVRLHARSDVPVGTCLSGGLDSSAIVCIAEELRRENLIPHYAHHAIGYVPGDPSLSEERYMRAVIDATGAELSLSRPTADEIVAAIPQIVVSQDEPFGSASIAAQWFVFAVAQREGLKVMLDGQGSDEMLAGYHGYVRQLAEQHLRDRRPLAYLRTAAANRALTGSMPLPLAGAVSALLRGWKTSAATPPAPPEAALLAPSLRAAAQPDEWTAAAPQPLDEALVHATTASGVPALLRFEDRNSMAHSIEARVPFLDHRLVEYALRLPVSSKVRGTELKSILRRALRDVLPEEVRTRSDKIGFRAEPRVTWQLAEQQRESLERNRTALETAVFDERAVRSLFDRRGGSDAEFLLWRVINLKLWARLVAEPG